MGKYYPGLEKRDCYQKQLSGRKLESAAWTFALDILTNREIFEQALLDAQAKQARVTDLNTPGGTAVSYTRFVPMAREIDLATIFFEQTRAMCP